MKKKLLPFVLVASLLGVSVGAYAQPASTGNGANVQKVVNGKLNVNTATAQQLIQLPYVGTDLAKRIVQYREKHGAFKSIQAMSAVKGIGPHRVKRIEKLAVV
jgi:competence protein ComEA